ncbi:unnamed protein product, partial [Gulo gulo]
YRTSREALDGTVSTSGKLLCSGNTVDDTQTSHADCWLLSQYPFSSSLRNPILFGTALCSARSLPS